MLFASVDGPREEGFVGFRRIGDLFQSCSGVPDERGNYLVLYINGHRPGFVNRGVGPAFHNGRALDYQIGCLKQRWVDGTVVIYIGQAGGRRHEGSWSNETLHDRVVTYMKYGQGHDVAHRGGRSIWQIREYPELVLCWRPLPDNVKDPRQVEGEMIRGFKSTHDGKRPFANTQG